VPRAPRLQIADGVYHVTVRGNDRQRIFSNDGERRRFMALLAEVKGRCAWQLLAYCLMSNHYHLLLKTPNANLAEGMHRLNGVYAQAFNRWHRRTGHLFQSRYGARLVDTDGHLLSTIRYIARNPVRAGLCADPAEWPWSSHRALVRRDGDRLVSATVVLSYYDASPTAARQLYREQTERPDEPELERPALSDLLRSVEGDPAIALAREHGYSLREIARQLGVNASTVSRRLAGSGNRALRSATPGPDPGVAAG
jgi:REP element-mobilizing transposase RayT